MLSDRHQVIEPGNGKRLKAFEDENVKLKKGSCREEARRSRRRQVRRPIDSPEGEHLSVRVGENIGARKMPNDDDREMLTEVVALYLAAHMKAQAALTMALVSHSHSEGGFDGTNRPSGIAGRA
jgi:hypothetical protein